MGMTQASSSERIVEVESGRAAPTHTTRILIADKFEPSGVDALDDLGCDVMIDPDLTADTLAHALAEHDPDILIVRSTKVPLAAIDGAKGLNLIIRAGAGYDTIDVSAASDRGIFVANCPGRNSIAVAELVWALILSCDRRVPDQTADLRNSVWNKKEYSKAAGLYGKTLGIVGLGQIGLEVARRGEAFGMKIVAWSRSLTEERADELGVGYVSKLLNLAKMADVISVNVAATADTQHLINEQFCQAMRPGAYFINTSRGSVVDEAALTKAIREKGIRAGLDVFESEPGGGTGEFTSPIVKEPGVYGTHHVGASTQQAQEAIAAETVRIVKSFLTTGEVPNCVNRAALTPATILLTVRHLNKPGVLAHVFYTLGQAGINVEEMENVIYDGAKAACARIQLDDTPGEEHIQTISNNENVLSVDLQKIRK
jgi:D-3-phosphoglycerate dehydrogenase / 2-oxoglutarate reductase